MSLKDLAHKAKVALGVDENRTVADEAAAELRRKADERKEAGDD